MREVKEGLDRLAARTWFSGVVRVDRAGKVEIAEAYGLAHRGYDVANEVGTRFGIASGTKGLTALTVVSLIEQGRLGLDTAVREVLRDDLPLVGDTVTVEHLLSHRSGVGDHVDEEADFDPTDYILTVPVHELATTEEYLRVLDGHPPKFPPGERFCYCNSGYVVLALVAERVAGLPFPDLVRERVCEPAGMRDTKFLRSDEPAPGVAMGYLSTEGYRTNVFHLPVAGSGDGGIYSTVADIHALWDAFFSGRIVSPGWVAEMVRPRSDAPEESMRYGLGFWLHQTGAGVLLVGYDAGVSFYTVRDPEARLTWTVVSNTTDGAWPLARYLEEALG